MCPVCMSCFLFLGHLKNKMHYAHWINKWMSKIAGLIHHRTSQPRFDPYSLPMKSLQAEMLATLLQTLLQRPFTKARGGRCAMSNYVSKCT